MCELNSTIEQFTVNLADQKEQIITEMVKKKKVSYLHKSIKLFTS